MPELPDVDVFRGYLEEHALERKVTRVKLRPDGMTTETSEAVLRRALRGHPLTEKMPGSWLLPHREEGSACPRCDGPIRKIKVSGRSTYFWDRHQES